MDAVPLSHVPVRWLRVHGSRRVLSGVRAPGGGFDRAIRQAAGRGEIRSNSELPPMRIGWRQIFPSPGCDRRAGDSSAWRSRLPSGRRSAAAGNLGSAQRPFYAKGAHGLSWCRDSDSPSHVARVGVAPSGRTPSRGLSAGRWGRCSQKWGLPGHRRGVWARIRAATGFGGEGSDAVPDPAASTRLVSVPARRRRPPGAARAVVPMSVPIRARRRRRSEHGKRDHPRAI